MGEELQKVEEIYRKCGYPGAMGSVDCTHFKWEATPFSERTIHQGKEGYTTVEATCDHAGRIIAATKSYPGAENDKTVIPRDESIWRIRDEEPWKSFPYKLPWLLVTDSPDRLIACDDSLHSRPQGMTSSRRLCGRRGHK